jgi:hypothetical protein
MAEKDSSCLLRDGSKTSFFIEFTRGKKELTSLLALLVRSSIQKRLFRAFKSKFAARRIEINSHPIYKVFVI